MFDSQDGIPILLPNSLLGDAEQRQHALYAAVAHEYDDVGVARADWERSRDRLAVVRDLATALGLLGEDPAKAPLALTPPRSTLRLRDSATPRLRDSATAVAPSAGTFGL